VSGFNSEWCPASRRNRVRLQIGTLSGFKSESASGFIGMREASNRSRVADLSPSTARDLFEAGLNEAACCVMSAYQPSTGTGPTLSEPHFV
jgi:hypothetical protein